MTWGRRVIVLTPMLARSRARVCTGRTVQRVARRPRSLRGRSHRCRPTRSPSRTPLPEPVEGPRQARPAGLATTNHLATRPRSPSPSRGLDQLGRRVQQRQTNSRPERNPAPRACRGGLDKLGRRVRQRQTTPRPEPNPAPRARRGGLDTLGRRVQQRQTHSRPERPAPRTCRGGLDQLGRRVRQRRTTSRPNPAPRARRGASTSSAGESPRDPTPLPEPVEGPRQARPAGHLATRPRSPSLSRGLDGLGNGSSGSQCGMVTASARLAAETTASSEAMTMLAWMPTPHTISPAISHST